MHERMKPITELVRNGTEITILMPKFVFDRKEKQEAIEYLKNDEKLYLKTLVPEYDEEVIITIGMDNNSNLLNEIICGSCQHIKGIHCELTGNIELKETCNDYKEIVE